jgi:ribonuclease BN (tRNA processing enzyme)
MRLTVLGSSASYAGPGQACSSYLVEAAGRRVLLDCGHGSLANLARVIDPAALDAVFVTHGHPDHFADLYALQALLRFAPSGPLAPLRVHAPAGLLDRMTCVLSGHAREQFFDAFMASDLVDGETVSIGELHVTPRAVSHEGEAFALVVESEGRRLCYTGDTRSDSNVLAAATGSNLVLAEATLPEEYGGKAPHMTAGQAAAVARSAGAQSLMLTHLWPATPRQDILSAARAAYNGEVRVAEEMLSVDV